MSDFNVAVRGTYRDVARMVLDLRPYDHELTQDHKVKWWRNAAPQPWTTGGPRLAVAYGEPAQRPTVESSGGGAVFLRSASRYLEAPDEGSLGAASYPWTIAFEYRFSDGSGAGSQCVLSSTDDSFRVWRKNATHFGFQTSAGFVSSGMGDLPEGLHVLSTDGLGGLDWWHQNMLLFSGVTGPFTFPHVYLGRDSGGNYLDGILRSVRVWNRVVSPRELDFLHQGLTSEDLSALAPDERAVVSVRSWTDGTGDLSLRQASRVNPSHGQQQSFKVVQVPAGEAVTLQLACETGGTVLPDSQLAGANYSLRVIERASAAVPVVSQDAAWSSVFDVRLSDPGHYTFLLERDGHGGMYVHVDAEVA